MTDTKRLYYEDVYIKEFSAKVVECRKGGEGLSGASGSERILSGGRRSAL